MHHININVDELGPIKLAKIFYDNKHLNESIIHKILQRLIDVLFLEPNVLYLQAPIIVCGNIRGELYELFQIFSKSGDDFLNATSEPTKLNNSYLFLGNYAIRGYKTIETFIFLASLKIKYPYQIFLLRGKDECPNENQINGLFEECLYLYGHSGLWHFMNDAFIFLPIAAVIDNRIFCVNGGLSPRINFIGQISTLYRRTHKNKAIEDLLWSRPESVSKFIVNRKSLGYYFGKRQTFSFLYNNGLMKRGEKLTDDDIKDPRNALMILSLGYTKDGFEWCHENKIVLISSAPKYFHDINCNGVFVKLTKDQGPNIININQSNKKYNKNDDTEIEYLY